MLNSTANINYGVPPGYRNSANGYPFLDVNADRTANPGSDSGAPRTLYCGHRAPPPHVRAAARAADAVDRTIDNEPFDPARGDEQYMSRKDGAMQHAVLNQVMRSPSTAGPLDGVTGNIVLQPAARSLVVNFAGGM